MNQTIQRESISLTLQRESVGGFIVPKRALGRVQSTPKRAGTSLTNALNYCGIENDKEMRHTASR
jgi:hypothetical protein